jgi:hypothetical protein
VSEIEIGGETDTRNLEHLLKSEDRWIDRPVDAVHLLCTLQAHVARSLDLMPSDCVCPDVVDEKIATHRKVDPGLTRRDWERRYFRNNGDAIRFIARATLAALSSPPSTDQRDGSPESTVDGGEQTQ